jgi:hypothetical protein
MLRKEKDNGADGRRGEVLQRFFDRLDRLKKTEPQHCRDALLSVFAHQDQCDELRRAIREVSKRPFFRELPDAERRDFSSLWRRLLDEAPRHDENLRTCGEGAPGYRSVTEDRRRPDNGRLK